MCIWLVPLASGTITLEAPSTVMVKESFTVTIEADVTEQHDVKIYIRNASDVIFSEIQDGDWKNGRYYINDAYPKIKLYTLRSIAFTQEAHLCAKLRLSEKRKTKPPTPESCIPIILQTQSESPVKNAVEKPSPNKQLEDQPESSPRNSSKTKKNEDFSQALTLPVFPSTSSQSEEKTLEKIALYSPPITGQVIITAREKTHIAIMAIFFIFTIAILIWMIRYEKIKREQENI